MFKGLARLMVRGGVLLFATYVTWTLLAGIGEAMAAEQALRIAGWTYEGSDPFLQEVFMGDSLAVFGLPVPADWNVTFETWPILIACALVLLGAAFSAGERMQEDTEGLV